ncbi:unnamed protein product, partial [Didymodactylos carnosus]
MDIWSEVAGK